MAITTLSHRIDIEWLREAYRRTRKDGATGVDGQTAAECAANLEGNLRSLLERAQSGTCRARPGGGCRLRRATGRRCGRSQGRSVRRIPSRRVRDGVLARLIGKWLNAGVLEAGELSFPDAGTPQGGGISPLLANVYLHDVLDVWFERMVEPVMHGAAFLHRYADDAVMVFADEADARRVMAVLPKGFDSASTASSSSRRKRAWCRSGAQRCRKRRHDPIPSNTAAAVGSCEGTTGTMASLGTR